MTTAFFLSERRFVESAVETSSKENQKPGGDRTLGMVHHAAEGALDTLSVAYTTALFAAGGGAMIFGGTSAPLLFAAGAIIVAFNAMAGVVGGALAATSHKTEAHAETVSPAEVPRIRKYAMGLMAAFSLATALTAGVATCDWVNSLDTAGNKAEAATSTSVHQPPAP